MTANLFGRKGLRLFWIAKIIFILQACDSQDPSFEVESSKIQGPEKLQSLDAEAFSADGLATSKDGVVIIKDNGLPVGEGGSIPPSLSGNISEPGGSPGGSSGGGSSGGGMPGETGSVEEQLTVSAINGQFKAAVTGDGSTAFSIENLLQESRYEMSAELSENAQSFSQINRPTIMQNFQQGHAAQATMDSFMQNANNVGVLDVLVVIDNSGSMTEEQNNLSSKLAPLLSEVSNSDWQIGVVTTDNGCLRDLIKKGDANAEADFAAAVSAGINGSGNEQGIRYAVEGLNQGCQATPWLRADSTLAVLFVSDEDNCSNNGSGCGSNPWNSEQYLMDHLTSIRQPGVNARVYGIFWQPSVAHAQCSTGAYKATQYSQIVTATGGTSGSICDADYSSTLSQISQDIAVILQNQFVLTHTPEPGSLVVKVNGAPVTTGFTLTDKTLTFTTAPAEGATIEASYEYGYSPIYTSFVLSTPAVAYQMSVEVNNSVIPSTSYNFDQGSNTVEFMAAPADNAQIKVTFRKDVPLLKDFDISYPVYSQAVTVKVNGQALNAGDFSYDAANKKVSLVAAPYDGSSILISYTGVTNPVLNYPYQMGEEQNSLEAYDLETGNPIPVAFNQGEISIPNGEFEYGRRFAVKDPDATGINDYSVGLPVGPIEETVVVNFGSGECRPPTGVLLNGSDLNLENCEFGSSIEDGEVQYKYIISETDTFSLDPSFFETEHKAQIWRVWLNGELITDYEINANQVKVTRELTYTDNIEIRVSLIQAI